MPRLTVTMVEGVILPQKGLDAGLGNQENRGGEGEDSEPLPFDAIQVTYCNLGNESKLSLAVLKLSIFSLVLSS